MWDRARARRWPQDTQGMQGQGRPTLISSVGLQQAPGPPPAIMGWNRHRTRQCTRVRHTSKVGNPFGRHLYHMLYASAACLLSEVCRPRLFREGRCRQSHTHQYCSSSGRAVPHCRDQSKRRSGGPTREDTGYVALIGPPCCRIVG
ncbi:hypothetical protein NDU88_003742 [Pleurodeles waltl]|uniref:Uncharacterized protein n=1 Tax=Pleurodeles waltl TaxID=8319 RepID=A0AAV7WTV7_PLEWA|nr:hypothetical protein NDU88_003742 [Pleurodeles waltl]